MNDDDLLQELLIKDGPERAANAIVLAKQMN